MGQTILPCIEGKKQGVRTYDTNSSTLHKYTIKASNTHFHGGEGVGIMGMQFIGFQ